MNWVAATRGHNALGIPAAMVIRCLILFNFVFAVELTLDLFMVLSQQFGGDATAFKTYVRRGAYPLVAAALLAGAFVLVTFRPGSATEKSNAARKLVYLWIGQTIILTLSAVWRLERYIELTELTRLRIASIVWFTLVGLGLGFSAKSKGHPSAVAAIAFNGVVLLLHIAGLAFGLFAGLVD